MIAIMGFTFTDRDILLLGAAFGWVICACCFMLIPAWRDRKVRHLSNDELLLLCDEVLCAMKRRSGTRHDSEKLESCRRDILRAFPSRTMVLPPRYDDDE